MNLFAKLGLLALAIACAGGCAVDTDDTDDAAEDEVIGADDGLGSAEAALSAAGTIRVAQVNPFFAGKFDSLAKKTANYATADRLMQKLVAKPFDNRISVIGMEEVNTEAETLEVQKRLVAATKFPWQARHFHATTSKGRTAMGTSIFYRGDLYGEVQSFGTCTVDMIDSADGKSTYPITFGGLLLRTKGAKKTFGVFAGKLVWAGQTQSGRALDDDSRVAEVNRLEQWIGSKMSGHPNATRIVTTDMNAERGSRPWKAFESGWSDGGAKAATWNGRRYDFVFWDDRSDAIRKTKNVRTPTTSGNYGSDHRFVGADVLLRDSN